MYNVYVLKSKRNGKNYIGLTRKHPEERLREHNAGVSSYTRRNRPYDFARKRERFFKTGHGRSVLKCILEKVSV